MVVCSNDEISVQVQMAEDRPNFVAAGMLKFKPK